MQIALVLSLFFSVALYGLSLEACESNLESFNEFDVKEHSREVLVYYLELLSIRIDIYDQPVDRLVYKLISDELGDRCSD